MGRQKHLRCAPRYIFRTSGFNKQRRMWQCELWRSAPVFNSGGLHDLLHEFASESLRELGEFKTSPLGGLFSIVLTHAGQLFCCSMLVWGLRSSGFLLFRSVGLGWGLLTGVLFYCHWVRNLEFCCNMGLGIWSFVFFVKHGVSGVFAFYDGARLGIWSSEGLLNCIVQDRSRALGEDENRTLRITTSFQERLEKQQWSVITYESKGHLSKDVLNQILKIISRAHEE